MKQMKSLKFTLVTRFAACGCLALAGFLCACSDGGKNTREATETSAPLDSQITDVVLTDEPAEGETEFDTFFDNPEAADGRAPGVKRAAGVHSLALARWSKDSVDKFADALTSPHMPRSVEITFVPFWNDDDPFGKACLLIKQLRDKSKRVSVTVYLGYHPKIDNVATIAEHSAKFKTGLLDVFNDDSNVVFNLSPGLEDYFESKEQFANAARAMVQELDWNKVRRLQVRWNPGPDYDHLLPGKDKFNMRVPVNTDSTKAAMLNQSGSRVFAVQTEFHGELGRIRNGQLKAKSKVHAFSNDGVFVSLDNAPAGSPPEDADSAENSMTFTKAHKPSLSEFIGIANDTKNTSASNTGVFLLWRPAFNLWKKSTAPNGKARYTQEGDVEKREDDPPVFGNAESEAVIRFLRRQ